jgi:hypothetical protein
VPADYGEQLEALLAQDRRSDMVALFLVDAAAIPAPFVEQLRQAPLWGAQEAFAHTLIHDATMMGDYAQRRSLPGQQHNVEPGAIAPVLAEFFAA